MEEFLLNLTNNEEFEAVVNKTGIKVHCIKSDDYYGVRVKRCKKKYRLFELTIFLVFYTPLNISKEEKEMKEEKAWHRRCKKIEERLKKSGLWQDLIEIFHNLQKMSLRDKKDIENLYWNYWFDYSSNKKMTKDDVLTLIYDKYGNKYPFIFNETGLLNTDYIGEISEAKTKSMYFGRFNKESKEKIEYALLSGTAIDIRGYTSYDVSFKYDAEKNKAWYSEEYKNCGNGHYYLALDNSAALFVEND